MHKMEDFAKSFVDIVIDAKVECSLDFAEEVCIDCKFNLSPGEIKGSCLLMTTYYALKYLNRI